jgi:hypothetical protein
MIAIRTRVPDPPLKLLELIEKRSRRLHYTNPSDLFHLVWLDGDNFAGVFGDGANGSYEFFTFLGQELTTSDAGYGSSGIALREVLVNLGDRL